jgi:hypothetical protein
MTDLYCHLSLALVAFRFVRVALRQRPLRLMRFSPRKLQKSSTRLLRTAAAFVIPLGKKT